MDTNDFRPRILEGEEHFTQGRYEPALRIFEDVLTLDPLNIEALNDAGLSCAALNDPPAAARYYEHALHVNAAYGPAFFNLLDLLIGFGDMDLLVEAFVQYEGGIPGSPEKEIYRKALFAGGDGMAESAKADVSPAAVSPAAVAPAPQVSPHHEVLRSIHDALLPFAYVEIGVGHGDSLALAGSGTVAIGIDPRSAVDADLPGNVRLFEKSSDAFFRECNLKAELGGRAFGLAYLNGMRLFEYALRDFMHLEKYAAPGSVIVVNDGYPTDALKCSRERRDGDWSGDVWKLIVCLKKYRQDLVIRTVDVAPAGLGIITNLNPGSTVLVEQMEAIYREFIPMPFDALAGDKASMLNRLDNDPELIRVLVTGGMSAAKPAAEQAGSDAGAGYMQEEVSVLH